METLETQTLDLSPEHMNYPVHPLQHAIIMQGGGGGDQIRGQYNNQRPRNGGDQVNESKGCLYEYEGIRILIGRIRRRIGRTQNSNVLNQRSRSRR